MSTLKVQGYWPATVTPFDASGALRYDDFRRIVRWLVDGGAQGICIAGDNGESWALTPDERGRLVREARAEVGTEFPLVLGASAPTTRQSIAYAEIAAREGADGILLMPQTYVLKATRAELVSHFRKVGAAVALPIVAYNSPRRAGIALTVDDLAAIVDAAPIVGLKESTRDMAHLSEVIRRLGERIAIMTGPASFVLPAIALGAHGFISSGPELLGPLASRLMDLGHAAPSAESRHAHHALNRVYEALMSFGTWPAALKAGVNLMGQPAGVPRDPVQPLPSDACDRLATLLRGLGAPVVAA
ncbi:MAG: dihydrodipicolinate synthase family protein [Betaproteobacteria bacterium]